jgi:hypothetical protein
VLAFHYVSVTFAVDAEGAITFWLTKESGRVPYCDGQECDGISQAELSPQVLRGYVVVLVAERTAGGDVVYVCFASFSYETLLVVMTSVLYSFSVQSQLSLQGMRVAGVGDVMSALHKGMFSSEQPCLCSAGFGKCMSCATTVAVKHRFIYQMGFSGLYPLGSEHWWRGVSDAAGDVNGVPWLRCCCAAVRLIDGCSEDDSVKS